MSSDKNTNGKIPKVTVDADVEKERLALTMPGSSYADLQESILEASGVTLNELASKKPTETMMFLIGALSLIGSKALESTDGRTRVSAGDDGQSATAGFTLRNMRDAFEKIMSETAGFDVVVLTQDPDLQADIEPREVLAFHVDQP